MYAGVIVKNRTEAEALKRGLAQEDVKAFVIMMGHLHGLPDDAARRRVLRALAVLFSRSDHEQQEHLAASGLPIDQYPLQQE